jgi:hypothetical protein
VFLPVVSYNRILKTPGRFAGQHLLNVSRDSLPIIFREEQLKVVFPENICLLATIESLGFRIKFKNTMIGR